MILRLYFNRHGTLPWSVDNGLGTVERTCKSVVIEAVFGTTVYRPLESWENPKETPCAWVEYRDCDFMLVGPVHHQTGIIRKQMR